MVVIGTLTGLTEGGSFNDILSGTLLANVPVDGDYALEVLCDMRAGGTDPVNNNITCTILIGPTTIVDNGRVSPGIANNFPYQPHIFAEVLAGAGQKITMNFRVNKIASGSGVEGEAAGTIRYAIFAVPATSGLLG